MIHLGDVSFTFVTLKVALESLPGRKVLVRGNHDPHTVSWYMANGFDFACDGAVVGSAYLTHRPQEKIPDGCQWNVHAHLHNRYPKGYRVWPHCRLFALEYTDYEPRILDAFIKQEARWHKQLLESGQLELCAKSEAGIPCCEPKFKHTLEAAKGAVGMDHDFVGSGLNG